MRLTKLHDNLLNKKLAAPIRAYDGKKLISEGVEISDKLLERLKNYHINAIYVEDENVNVEPDGSIADNKRFAIVDKLNQFYRKISQNIFDEFFLGKLIRDEILPETANGPVSIPVAKEIKNDDIAEHSLNVCLISIMVSRLLGLDEKKIEIIAKAAILHDIGKIIKVDKSINLQKAAYQFLKERDCSIIVSSMVRLYSETLEVEEPSNEAFEAQEDMVKVLNIANYYEHLLRENNLLPYECFEKMKHLANNVHYSKVFNAFQKAIYFYPVGLPVKLNNGEEGIIVAQNSTYPLRPRIKTERLEYNLLSHLRLSIQEVVL